MNCVNDAGYTPLMDASKRNNIPKEIIMILLEYGADINLCLNKSTALLNASALGEGGRWNIVKLLLLHGANPNVCNSVLRTPLHYACWHYRIDVIEALLELKADCNYRDVNNCTPLHYVMEYGIEKEKDDLLHPVRQLLEYGANVNIQDSVGETLLHYAIRAIVMKYRYKKIPDRVVMLIQVLLEFHSNINIEVEMTYEFCCGACTSYKGDTPLHLTVRFELIDIVKILLVYHLKSFHHVETALNIAKTNLKSFLPLTCGNKDHIMRLQNIINCIEVWRRQQIYLYLIESMGEGTQ